MHQPTGFSTSDFSDIWLVIIVNFLYSLSEFSMYDFIKVSV